MSDSRKKIRAWETLNRSGQWIISEGDGVEYTLTAEVEAMIRKARQEERDACLAIIEDMKSDAAIAAAERARYTAMQMSNASFNECRHRIRGRSTGAEE